MNNHPLTKLVMTVFFSFRNHTIYLFMTAFQGWFPVAVETKACTVLWRVLIIKEYYCKKNSGHNIVLATVEYWLK